VNASRFLLLVLVLLQFSCLPKKPEIAGVEAPAGPFVRSLEQQRRSFHSLDAVASVRAERRGKKRAFDSVGIVMEGRRRLRVEAFGPLGQSLLTLVWDGDDVLLRQEDGKVRRAGAGAIEKLLGTRMDARTLCAVLSGTVTEIDRPSDARAFCRQDGACVLELSDRTLERRITVLPVPSGPPGTVRMASRELYSSDDLVYRVRYEGALEFNDFMLPRTVMIEDPDEKAMLTVEYTDADVNVPLPEGAFTLDDEGAGVR
jgi:hypothetical protein